MRAAGALQIFAAKLAEADSVISAAQLTAPESASTPIYYPARLYLALRLYCFHGNEELTGSRGLRRLRNRLRSAARPVSAAGGDPSSLEMRRLCWCSQTCHCSSQASEWSSLSFQIRPRRNFGSV